MATSQRDDTWTKDTLVATLRKQLQGTEQRRSGAVKLCFMFLDKYVQLLNTARYKATAPLSLRLLPSFVSCDSYKHCTLVFGRRNSLFYNGTVTTNGHLPFYLRDEELQNGRMSWGRRAREEFLKLYSYITDRTVFLYYFLL